jgi:hypothetical protein
MRRDTADDAPAPSPEIDPESPIGFVLTLGAGAAGIRCPIDNIAAVIACAQMRAAGLIFQIEPELWCATRAGAAAIGVTIQ